MKNLVIFALLINALQGICTCPDQSRSSKASIHIQNYDGPIFLHPFNYPVYNDNGFDDEICHRNEENYPNTHTEIECTCVTKQPNNIPINNVPLNNVPINNVVPGTCYNSCPQLFTVPLYSNSADKGFCTPDPLSQKYNPNCRMDGVSVTYGQGHSNGCQCGSNYGYY